MAIVLNQNLGATAQVSGATTHTHVSTNAVASGAMVFAQVSWYESTALTGFTFGGLTWTIDAQWVNSVDGKVRTALCSAQAPSGVITGQTATATWGVAVPGAEIAMRSFTGLATSSVVDGSTAAGSTTGTGWAAPAITPSVADALIIGVCMGDGVDTTSTPLTNYTEFSDINTGGGGDSYTGAYRIVSSIAAYTVGGTWASGQSHSVAGAIVYKAAAGGSTDVPVSDSGTLSESSSVGIPNKTATDSGTLSETSLLNSSTTTVEGTLSESSVVGHPTTDGGSVADSSTLSTGTDKSGAESFAYAEVSSLVQNSTKTATDSGTLSESVSSTNAPTRTDAATLTDAGSSGITLARTDTFSLTTQLGTVGGVSPPPDIKTPTAVAVTGNVAGVTITPNAATVVVTPNIATVEVNN